MDRREMWELYGRLVSAGFYAQAETMKKAWNNKATLVFHSYGSEWFADIDPTPWEELLDEKASGESP